MHLPDALRPPPQAREEEEGQMSHSRVECYRQVLEAKKTELSIGLRNREGIAVTAQADDLDNVQSAGEREFAILSLDRESRLLRQVRDALERLRDGRYGMCSQCGAAISSKRLAAVPWAAHCVRCQEEADRVGESGSTEDVPEVLVG
jgi:DnaK suppressor protein